jgi:hypothetical protein
MEDAPNPVPMQESPNLPPVQQPKKSNKTLIIILIVVLVLCCVCLPLIYGAFYLYQNGDQFINQMNQGGYLLNFV